MTAKVRGFCLVFGAAMVGAAALRAMADLRQPDPFDPWAAVLALG